MSLENPRQQEVLTSPVRIEIIERLQGSGASSIADIARRMGRSAGSLYHHVHKLIAAGVLVEAGRRRAGRRWELLYRLAAPRFSMDLDRSSARNVRCYCRSASALLRLTDRKFREAVESGDVVATGRGRNLDANLKKARLSKSGLARVNQLLEEIHKVLREEDARGGGQPCALTTVLFPLSETNSGKKETT